MKRSIVLVIMSLLLLSCSNDDDSVIENTIEGRWHLVGFEQTVMYEFSSDLRYTIYSTDGNFGDIASAIPNPNPWVYDGTEIVIDLHFGNFLRATPEYRCNGNVVDLITQDGTTTLYREGFDYASC